MKIKDLNDPRLLEIRRLYNQDYSLQRIARETGIYYPFVYHGAKVLGLSTAVGRLKGKNRMLKRLNGRGYYEIFAPTHLNANCDGYVKEHVLAASKALGRPLKRNEVIHHINGDKLDNRNCNLLICDRGYHAKLHWRMSERYQREHFT